MIGITAAPATMSQDLARQMIPSIRRIAGSMVRRLPAHVRLDDLVGAGFQGLMAAHARFDAGRGDDFVAYAECRIRGAMLDELRSVDPLSRDRRALAKKTAAAARAASARLGRAATAEESAAELGISLEAYWDRLAAASGVVTMSLDDLERSAGEVQDASAEAPDEELARKQRGAAVQHALASLPPRLAQVVDLHFGEGLTLKEIGARLGVTESRVCQIVGEAVRLVRERCPEHAEHADRTGAPLDKRRAGRPARRSSRPAAALPS